MGFEIEEIEPRATLVIDDPRFVGVEVDVCTLLTASYYFALRQWGDQENAGDPTTPEGRIDALRIKAELFLEHGRPTWNLTRHGVPIPVTVAEILRLPVALGHAVIDAWIDAVGTVPLPLPGTPTNGKASSVPARKKGTTSPRSSSNGAGPSPK